MNEAVRFEDSYCQVNNEGQHWMVSGGLEKKKDDRQYYESLRFVDPPKSYYFLPVDSRNENHHCAVNSTRSRTEDSKCKQASVQSDRVSTTEKLSETLEDYDSMYDDLFENANLEPNNVFISKDENETSNHINHYHAAPKKTVFKLKPKLRGFSSQSYPTIPPFPTDVSFSEVPFTSPCIKRYCETPMNELDSSSTFNTEPNLALLGRFAGGEEFHHFSSLGPASKMVHSHLPSLEASCQIYRDTVRNARHYASIEAQTEDKKRENIFVSLSHNTSDRKKLRVSDNTLCLALPRQKDPPSMKSCLIKDGCKGKAASAERTIFLHWTTIDTIKLNTREKFPQKLYRLLEETQANGLSHVISFTNSGNSFRVHDKTAFLKQVIPRYFRHQTINSFLRQLNYYGFERAQDDDNSANSGTYAHPFFQRGSPSNCHAIRRDIEGKKR